MEQEKVLSKQQLYEIIQDYIKTYDHDPFWGGELQFLKERLDNMVSSIAVVGQFSVGKSALLNALLGEKLLTTKKIESTKVLTRIRHCQSIDDAKVLLTYQHGAVEDIALQHAGDLLTYTTFQGDASLTNDLRYVDLYWPVSFLNDELILIDTPGANSVTTSAFQTTMEQLRESSAMIYLFLGTKGLDLQDYELLEAYLKRQKKIFLVGTNRDKLTDEQWAEVKAEVTQKIQRFDALKRVEILGVSSLDALEAKQQRNQTLLEQSHLPKLEQKIKAYMETRAYEQAELQSIQYDFSTLQQEIQQQQAGAQHEIDKEAQARAFRLKRLEAITTTQYNEVLIYGEKLLNERDLLTKATSEQYREKLFSENQGILKKVKKAYSDLQQQFRQMSDTIAPDIATLQHMYVTHIQRIENIYHTWDQTLTKVTTQFHNAVRDQVKAQDGTFLHLLKAMEAQVVLEWDDFDLMLKNIKLKPLLMNQELEGFKKYADFIEDAKKEQAQLEKKVNDLQQKRQALTKQAAIHSQHVEMDAESQRSRLGKKPKPKELYEKKGFIFKREKFVGYDYSAQEAWDRDIQLINQQKRQQLESIAQQTKREKRQIDQQLQQIEQEKEFLFEEEQETIQGLLDVLYTSIMEQSKEVTKLHTERHNDMKAQWQFIVTNQEEQCYEHVEAIKEAFKQFVENAKAKALRQLTVL